MSPVNNSATSTNLQTPPSLSPALRADLIKKGIFSMCTGLVTVAICNQVKAFYSTPSENFLAEHMTPDEYSSFSTHGMG